MARSASLPVWLRDNDSTADDGFWAAMLVHPRIKRKPKLVALREALNWMYESLHIAPGLNSLVPRRLRCVRVASRPRIGEI